MINLHESMEAGLDRIRDPWICSQIGYRRKNEMASKEISINTVEKIEGPGHSKTLKVQTEEMGCHSELDKL